MSNTITTTHTEFINMATLTHRSRPASKWQSKDTKAMTVSRHGRGHSRVLKGPIVFVHSGTIQSTSRLWQQSMRNMNGMVSKRPEETSHTKASIVGAHGYLPLNENQRTKADRILRSSNSNENSVNAAGRASADEWKWFFCLLSGWEFIANHAEGISRGGRTSTHIHRHTHTQLCA